MEIKTLYVYRPVEGTPSDPDTSQTISLRPRMKNVETYELIADDGKMLTLDGETLYCRVYVDSPDGWYEVDGPVNEHLDTDGPVESDNITAGEFVSMLAEVM